MENIIFFDITHSIDREGLIDWVSEKVSGSNTDLLNNIILYHSEEISNIVDYLLSLYGGKFVSPLTVSRSLPKAIEDCGYNLSELTSSTVITNKISNTVKM